MSAALLIAVFGAALLACLLVLRIDTAHWLRADHVVYSLKFPANLRPEDAERFLASLSGLLPPWWKRLIGQPVVAFELVATGTGISHQLVVPAAYAGFIESSLNAHLPGVRYEQGEATALPRAVKAAEYRLTSTARPLRVDTEGLSAGLLSATQPLGTHEQVVVQWLLTAAWPVRPPRLAQHDETIVVAGADLYATSEEVSARKNKLKAPLLLAVGRIGVAAGSADRALQLLRRVEGPWHASRAAGVHFRRRFIPSSVIAGRIMDRSVPLTHFPAVLNTAEAAQLLGWPVSGRAVPGLALGACRLLPANDEIPKTGTVLGTATFPGQDGRAVALDLAARYRHLAVTGPTGTGKTTLLTRVALQDLDAGFGLVVIDPKGELVDNILERAPETRLDGIIVLDAGRRGPAVGYNPLKASGETRELVVEQVLGTMRRIWQASWGPRTDHLLRACLFTLAHTGGMTLAEAPHLLTNEALRKRLMSKISDPFGVEAAWAQFDAWSEGERTAASAPLLNKLEALTTRPSLRSILGQVEGAIDFPRLVRERGVLLVNLSTGTLGTDAAYLLGALLFGGLWNAVSARGNLSPEKRAPVSCVVDEFQNVVKLPTPVETILTEARSYRLGLTLAHQHLGQLDSDLSHAMMANARSKVVFQTSRADAVTFARELGAGLTPEDMQGIPAYEAVAQVFARGKVQPPATIATADLPPKVREADEVRSASVARFGVPRDEVDAAIVERLHGSQAPTRQVGRARRGQP